MALVRIMKNRVRRSGLGNKKQKDVGSASRKTCSQPERLRHCTPQWDVREHRKPWKQLGRRAMRVPAQGLVRLLSRTRRNKVSMKSKSGNVYYIPHDKPVLAHQARLQGPAFSPFLGRQGPQEIRCDCCESFKMASSLQFALVWGIFVEFGQNRETWRSLRVASGSTGPPEASHRNEVMKPVPPTSVAACSWSTPHWLALNHYTAGGSPLLLHLTIRI